MHVVGRISVDEMVEEGRNIDMYRRTCHLVTFAAWGSPRLPDFLLLKHTTSRKLTTYSLLQHFNLVTSTGQALVLDIIVTSRVESR